LIAIYDQNISAESGFYASRALIAIGPDAARKAVSSFVRGAASSDALVRQHAVWALGDLHAEPSLVVPALMRALSDSNASVRVTAAMSLKEVGFAARPAVPALVRLLRDPDSQVRGIAAQALMRIDYDAAVKAGVK
jgi:HEAT repeat protein